MWFNPLRLRLISRPTSKHTPISKLRYRSIWLPRSDLSQDNIFAPATPTNTKSALSIIRVNGPDASNLYKLMTCSTKTKPTKDLHDDIQIPNRTIKLRKVFCHQTLDILDPEAIVMNFPHNNLTSTFEFHLHGSKSIIKSVIESLSKLPKFRIAKPGEFTLRRFERSNELDLNRLLGIKNLIDAETEEQRKMAIHQFESDQFSKVYKNLRKSLVDCMSLCEVILDFSEDGSIDDKLIWNQNSQRHEKVINGIRISLFGSPNVGKSTLLNWIVNREASIVSPYPGTTRDIVEVSIDFHGFPLIVSDTAGLRETEDPVEDIGISRAQANISKADLRLCLISAKEFISLYTNNNKIKNPIPDKLQNFIKPGIIPSLLIITKTDLVSLNDLNQIIKNYSINIPICKISIPTLSGTKELINTLKFLLKDNYQYDSENPIITSINQQNHLKSILNHLQTFLEYKLNEDDLSIAVEELREVAFILNNLIGDGKDVLDVDEILGEIFSGFCIGK